MKNDAESQIKTFNIFLSLDLDSLIHLCEAQDLEMSHYNTHQKRAAGMTVVTYAHIGLCDTVREKFDSVFAN